MKLRSATVCVSWPAPCPNSVSKGIFQRDLKDPRIGRALDRAERRRPDIADWVQEVGVIRQIEEFESQLHSMPFVDLEDSSHCSIERNPRRADKGIVPSVSESAGGICGEGSRVE